MNSTPQPSGSLVVDEIAECWTPLDLGHGLSACALDVEAAPTHRPGDAPSSAVVVLHELFGLTDHVRAVCRRLAELGHHVIAPDLLAPVRAGGDPAVLPETTEGRDKGFDLFAQLAMTDITRQVDAAIQHFAHAPVTVVGLSIGGYLAHRLPDAPAIDRAVLLYPGWLDTPDGPLHDHTRPLDQPHPDRDTLIITGDEDPLLPEPARDHIAAALTRDNPRSQLLTIPGAGHGFLAPHRPTHDDAHANQAWDAITAWLDKAPS